MRLSPIDNILYLYLRAAKLLDRRSTDIKAFDPKAVKTILAVSSTAIGDTLLSTPALRALRKCYPKARIVALLNAANMTLFATNPNIDEIVPYHGGYKKFFETIRRLKKENFDLAVILHGNEPQATPICYLAGARFIVKLPNTSRFRFLLSNGTEAVGWKEIGHGIEGRLAAVALAGCKSKDVRMELFIDKTDEAAVENYLKKSGITTGDILIGFQPGASTISRQWFPERFIELGKALTKADARIKIILTGSPKEGALCKGIAEGIGRGVINACGALPLKQVPALIKKFKTIITGDTGPMHIAIAVGTPVIALYAVADPRRTGPLYDKEKHRVIQKPRTCDPCVSKLCKYQKCMEAISVEEVLSCVKDLLEVRA